MLLKVLSSDGEQMLSTHIPGKIHLVGQKITQSWLPPISKPKKAHFWPKMAENCDKS